MKLKKILILLLILLIITTIGCSTKKVSSKDLLTLETIVKTFETQGIVLKEDTAKSPDAYEFNEVKPAIYKIGKTQDNLLIYIFDSFVNKSKNDNPSYFIEKVNFVARNALLVYMPATIPKSQDEILPLIKTKKSISNIVFKHFNDGKKIIYQGESEHWEAKVTLEYYQNWWDDENGKRYYQSANTAHHKIKYKMVDVNNVGPVFYEYATSTRGSGSANLTLDNKGYGDAGSRGGDSSWLKDPEKDIFHITIKWNQQEETFDLKVK